MLASTRLSAQDISTIGAFDLCEPCNRSIAQITTVDLGYTVDETECYHESSIDSVNDSSLLLVRVDRVTVEIETVWTLSIATLDRGVAGLFV